MDVTRAMRRVILRDGETGEVELLARCAGTHVRQANRLQFLASIVAKVKPITWADMPQVANDTWKACVARDHGELARVCRSLDGHINWPKLATVLRLTAKDCEITAREAT
eukprot:8391625-Alexandrium_andersonii.AAC.1